MKLILAICVVVCLWMCLLAYSVEGLFVSLFTVGEEMKKAFLLTYRYMIYLFFIGDFFSANISIILKSLGK